MRCPFCDGLKDRVTNSREAQEGLVIRRRRECLECGRRFTSYERIEEIPYMVVKKGGRREAYDRGKVLGGLLRACEKRPVSPQQLDEIVESVEQRLADSSDRELPSEEIGQVVMQKLRRMDKVAYVRFASVYLEFEDVFEFMDEINHLVKKS